MPCPPLVLGAIGIAQPVGGDDTNCEDGGTEKGGDAGRGGGLQARRYVEQLPEPRFYLLFIAFQLWRRSSGSSRMTSGHPKRRGGAGGPGILELPGDVAVVTFGQEGREALPSPLRLGGLLGIRSIDMCAATISVYRFNKISHENIRGKRASVYRCFAAGIRQRTTIQVHRSNYMAKHRYHCR